MTSGSGGEQQPSTVGQSVTSTWMVVWLMPKWSRSWWLTRSRRASLSARFMSVTWTWLERAWEFEPRLQMWRS